jgi:hypothetical protein
MYSYHHQKDLIHRSYLQHHSYSLYMLHHHLSYRYRILRSRQLNYHRNTRRHNPGQRFHHYRYRNHQELHHLVVDAHAMTAKALRLTVPAFVTVMQLLMIAVSVMVETLTRIVPASVSVIIQLTAAEYAIAIAQMMM